jgi:RNA polymerase sigma-70 factor (ECF subfamily)
MVPTSQFPATRWSLVVTAGGQNGQAAEQALAELCRTYWYPIFAYVRRYGNSPEDAQDLTQDFFARFLEKRHVSYAVQEKGRFRSFLLVSIKRFLTDRAERRAAEKRGGREALFAMDLEVAEQRYGAVFADHTTPETLFERMWATTLMARVAENVRTEFEREGRAEHFELLKQFLPGYEATLDYSTIAERAGTTEGAIKVAVHRLRRRYRETFYAEIAHVVSDPSQVDDELRHVLAAMRA